MTYLSDPKANDLAKEMVTEFLDSTLKGKSLAEYNQIQVLKWKEEVDEQQQYLIDTKSISFLMQVNRQKFCSNNRIREKPSSNFTAQS